MCVLLQKQFRELKVKLIKKTVNFLPYEHSINYYELRMALSLPIF